MFILVGNLSDILSVCPKSDSRDFNIGDVALKMN